MEKMIIFEHDLEIPVRKIDFQIEVSFRLASEKDIDSMDKEHYDYDQKSKKYAKERLKKDDKCILMLHKDKIIGYSWIMKDSMELSQFNHIPLVQDRIYTYKGFVLKEFRGKKVLNTCDIYKIDLFKKNGKKFWVTTVAKDNKSSINARERIGMKRIGKIIQFRFLGLQYDYISKKDLSYLQTP